MTCEEVRDELVAYARGELSETRRKEVDVHLVRCGDCLQELEGTRDVLGITSRADAASIKEVAKQVIATALARRASDIHLEMSGDTPRVRFRIDGVLQLQPDPVIPVEQYGLLIERIKYMAEMNLSEKRVPQDGRIAITHEGKEYQLRVSVFPYLNGESAVIRLLDRSSVLIGLDRLGLSPVPLARIEALSSQPHGLLLTTGPTGAGKTTLLYSLLNRLNHAERMVMSIEDPVEYALEGVNQASTDRRVGLTFATALRAFMRQDPDIIMVSEIRDLETAEMEIQAALTGHLVLSVLHTPDATSALTRLTDMGAAPFVVAAAVTGVIGQRLVRRVCPECREEYQPPAALLDALGFPPGERPARFFHGAGCEACSETGYQGRAGLLELLTMGRELGQMVTERAPEAEIRARAMELGQLWTFAADARAKIAEGLTTVEEIDRVLPSLTTPGSR
jgi:type II secretory ATPase GspE/PulE/Tfp pilus assembly ATPase PilB-like protein